MEGLRLVKVPGSSPLNLNVTVSGTLPLTRPSLSQMSVYF